MENKARGTIQTNIEKGIWLFPWIWSQAKQIVMVGICDSWRGWGFKGRTSYGQRWKVRRAGHSSFAQKKNPQ